MSLKYEKWPLWSKKEGKKTWEMRHEGRFNYMEIWNSKSDCNTYSNFEEKFGVLPKVHFRHTIYCFEAQEVKSPTLQIVYKLKLKWRSYDHLKKLCKIEGSFQNDFEIQHMNLNPTYEFEIQLMNLKSNLWIWNPIQNDPNFEFTHCHFDVSPPLPRELHLGHSIRPKWTPQD